MHILLLHPGEPLVLDSIEGHADTRRRLVAFAASPDPVLELGADGRSSLAPGLEALRALRVRKSDGPILTSIEGPVLVVSGRPELLARYAEAFTFAPHAGGDEHHPEQAFPDDLAPGSLLTVVRADEGGATD